MIFLIFLILKRVNSELSNTISFFGVFFNISCTKTLPIEPPPPVTRIDFFLKKLLLISVLFEMGRSAISSIESFFRMFKSSFPHIISSILGISTILVGILILFHINYF